MKYIIQIKLTSHTIVFQMQLSTESREERGFSGIIPFPQNP